MSLATRPLAVSDRTSWEALWQAYLSFYQSSLPTAVTDHSFARLTDPTASERAGIVAVKDGEIIGFAHLITHAHNWHTRDVCYLQDLFVTPTARGIGAGRALIEASYTYADANNLATTYWLTQKDNTQARRLYDEVGALTPFVKYQRP